MAEVKMTEVKLMVDSFLRGEIGTEQLLFQLQQLLSHSPHHCEDVIKHLRELTADQGLLEEFAAFLSRLEQSYDELATEVASPATEVPQSAEPDTVSLGTVRKSASEFGWTMSSSGPVETADLLTAGKLIGGNYRLEVKVGEGGMGVVWKAVDLLQGEGEYVAIKFLHENFRQHPEALKTLKSEFGKYKQLSHPNIVRAYHLGREQSLVFLVMEFLEGISLREFIRNYPTGVPLAEAKSIFEGMGEGLKYAHQQGIVHLDLKPTNVFFEASTNTVKVIDFGIARRAEKVDRENTRFDPGQLHAFSESYASLEMLSESEPDPRDDVYALACVTYELLSGRHPFGKKSAAKAHREKLVPKPIKGLTRRQFQALLHGLALERSNRTASVEEFLTELLTVEPCPLRCRVGVGIAVTFLLIVGGAVWWWYSFDSVPPSVGRPVETVKNSVPPINPPPTPQPPPPKPAKVCNEVKILPWLAMAEGYMKQSVFVYPPGKNAVDKYHEVLTECPTNGQALDGLKQIAEIYKVRATTSWQKGQRGTCLGHVEHGLKAMSEHPGLLELKSVCQKE